MWSTPHLDGRVRRHADLGANGGTYSADSEILQLRMAVRTETSTSNASHFEPNYMRCPSLSPDMPPQKRSRCKPIKSCLECNRRKQRCNREKPCNHCTARGVEHFCVYSSSLAQTGISKSRRPPQSERRSKPSWNRHKNECFSTASPSSESDSSEARTRDYEYTPPGHYIWQPNTHDTNISFTLESQRSPELSEATLPSQGACPEPSSFQENWPDQSIVDFLIHMWIQVFNRLQELVHVESFRSQYAAWWAIHAGTKPDAASIDEDYDFGILILRICLISLQNLPHIKYPTEGVLKADLDGVEQWFYSLAGTLERSRSAEKKPSLITVQYQFFHVGYLKDYARLRECWSVLTTTIKDVHEMGLHLQHPNLPLTELEMEMRRRTFWNLYVFDRYMCTSFGHWPLIPEGYFDIDVPHDTIQALTTSPYVLTPFTDRVFHIKLARWQTAFMSPPAWQDDQRDPLVVAEFAQQFEEVIVNQLPAPFWIDNPDKSWDAVEPSISSKRETLYLSIFSTKAALYRAFADPCHSLGGKSRAYPDKGLIFLALSHRRTLMNVTCKVITSIQKTYILSDNGASYRLFMLPISLIDALASLGVCLLSIQADQRRLEMEGVQISPDAEVQCHYATFFEAFNLLCQLAPSYGIVQRGVKLLGSLSGVLRASLSGPTISDTFTPAIAVLPATMDPCGFDQVLGAETYPLEQALASLSPPGNADSHGCPLFPIPKWVPDYLESTSRSWLFQEKAFDSL